MFEVTAQAAGNAELDAQTLVFAQALVGFLMLFVISSLIVHVSAIFLFRKAGVKWFWALIPVYNLWCTCKLAGYPGYWALMSYIPLVGIVILCMVSIRLAQAFGKSLAFGIFTVLMPYIAVPILAFGKAQYVGPPTSSPTPAKAT